MSTFAAKVTKIRAIEPIDGADNIELAVIGDYRSVVRKNQFGVGDFVVYIPEAAIVPIHVLKELGLEGKLAGKEKNRVKPIKLRGCLSQGIVFPVQTIETYSGNIIEYFISVPSPEGSPGYMYIVHEGEDVAQELGITKYEPPIPIHMAGEIYNAGTENTVNFDVENIKAWPDVFQEGEQVCITEKIHGTFCGVGLLPESRANEKHIMNRFVVFSKGNGAKGLCFKDNPANECNLYLRVLKQVGIFEKIMHHYSGWCYPIFFLGEIYGKGVQDLTYGEALSFRVFDIVTGDSGDLKYMPPITVQSVLDQMKIDMVPILYTGPYNKNLISILTVGKETVTENSLHMKEGVVVRPLEERRHPNLGRVILKSVSAEYLLRKNGTEFN